MRISIGLYRAGRAKSESKELISSSAVWLSEDVVFIHDHLSKATAINTDRSNGRVHLASYDFDKNNVGFGNSIDAYVIFKKNSAPLLVGILRRNDGGLNSKHTILFELPLSEDEQAFSLARRNGFTVDPPDNETQWIDSDFISETYHDGSPVITTDTSTTYRKEIGKEYAAFISIEY